MAWLEPLFSAPLLSAVVTNVTANHFLWVSAFEIYLVVFISSASTLNVFHFLHCAMLSWILTSIFKTLHFFVDICTSYNNVTASILLYSPNRWTTKRTYNIFIQEASNLLIRQQRVAQEGLEQNAPIEMEHKIGNFDLFFNHLLVEKVDNCTA